MNPETKTRGQRLDELGEVWLEAMADAALAALWLSGLAARRVANALEWLAAKAEPESKDGAA